jgi:hypothetical protein
VRRSADAVRYGLQGLIIITMAAVLPVLQSASAAAAAAAVVVDAANTHRLWVRDQERVSLLDVAEDDEHQVEHAVRDHAVQHRVPVCRKLARAKV